MFGYGEIAIAQNITLSIHRGEWLSLIGANGSGKSTLLKLISRILAPQQGVVLLDGKGRPIKNIILLQPQQLIPLKQSYGKGLLWVEVYKEKQLIGKEKLFVADRY